MGETIFINGLIAMEELGRALQRNLEHLQELEASLEARDAAALGPLAFSAPALEFAGYKAEFDRAREEVGSKSQHARSSSSRADDLIIFISHRHEDERIAKTISHNLQRWGVPLSSIFFSSDPRTGLSAGDPISKSLIEWLGKSHLLILVYTTSEADWSYCMWECGVATDPETDRTRVVVFQCASSAPAVYESYHPVRLEKPQDVQEFVDRFHTRPDYIPRRNAHGRFAEGYAPDLAPEIRRERGTQLYEELKEAVQEGAVGQPVSIWDRIELVLSEETVQEIQASHASTELYRALRKRIEVGRNSSPTALRMFDFNTVPESMTLEDLWREWQFGDGEDALRLWDDVAGQICRAVQGRSPDHLKYIVRPSRRSRTWILPLVGRGQGVTSGRVAFYLYLCPTNLLQELRQRDPGGKTCIIRRLIARFSG